MDSTQLTPSNQTAALLDEADAVERGQLNSAEWTCAFLHFDLIRLAADPGVLAIVDEVKGQTLRCDELAALLRARASEGR